MSDNVTGGFGDQEYNFFSQQVQRKLGIRLADYKPDQMKRRLTTLAQKHGCSSFAQFASRIERDQEVCVAFLDTMTINVTELFRNPDLFKALQNDILPPVVRARGGSPMHAWSAGCSYGAEAFTLSIILHEMTGGNFKVKGTDIDLTVLGRAGSAPHFTALDMQSVPKDKKEQYFTTFDDKNYMPTMTLRRNVSFGPHDLLADPYPREQYDLILCRNVVIYFNDEAKERIYRGFFQALRPGGILFVGGTERLADHASVGFGLLRPFFYQKPLERAARLAA